jgi:drug/metabolite transporter (DMT)-like permease
MYQKLSGVYTSLTERYPKYLGGFFTVMWTITVAWALYSARRVGSLDTGNLLYFRGLINMAIGLSMAQLSGTPLFPTGKLEITILLLRMFICSFTINLRTLGVKIAPLQQYAVITKTDSLMTPLVLILFYGEKLNKWIGIAAVLSFTGILLVINPAIFGLGIPIED